MTVNTDLPIKVVSYGRVAHKNGPWHSGRSLDTNLFVYADEGSLKMQVGEEVFSLNAGDLLLVPAKTFYRPLDAGGFSYFFIHFSADTGEENSDPLYFRSNPLLAEGDYEYYYQGGGSAVSIDILTHCATNDNVKNIFRRITSINVRSQGEKLLLDCLVRELIVTICNENHQIGRLSSNAVRIISYIDRKYFEDITLSSISAVFGFSKSYIARLFKKELNTTSAAYLNRTRVANACRLLLCSNKNIGEISEAVGYKNQYYFSKIFKKEMGFTPSEYKKRNLTA